jgi:hypothetical protein
VDFRRRSRCDGQAVRTDSGLLGRGVRSAATEVIDRFFRARREVAENNDKNLLYSSTHGYRLALAKEAALHDYRDKLRRVERALTARRETEGRFHRFWRWRLGRPFPSLTVPQSAEPVLDAWREPITRHKGPAQEVVDPTRHDLDDVLADVREHGSTGYV